MSGARLDANFWVTEYISPTDVYHHGVSRVLAYQQTTYQEMAIVESGAYGKALVLDGKWQSCTGDEFLYHEPLVHVPCVYHGAPKRVLVLGGGEGATVREALKWKSVEHCAMVDLDGEVVEACKQHLAEMHQGAFDDPRTELVIGDALDYLDGSDGDWDVIISDLSDPIEEGPSFKLFTREYFQKCRQALATGGVFVVQAGPLAPPEMNLHVRLNRTVADVFAHATSYQTSVPTYASPWGYVIGRDGQPFEKRMDPVTVDALLAEQVDGPLRMFDGEALVGLMHLPRHLRDAIAQETQVFTLDQPPSFFGKGIAGAGEKAG